MSQWKQQDAITTLNSIVDANMNRYSYALARYLARADVDLRNYSEYTWATYSPLVLQQDGDLLYPPSTNVIKSCIDSLVSKLANNKTRPFFAPVNGTYNTKRVVKQAQQFFDIYYDAIDLNHIVQEAFKDACIFGIGYILIDPFTYEVERVPTYCVGTLHTELQYKTEPTMCLLKWRHMPSTMLDKWSVATKSSDLYHNVEMYIDSNAKKAVLFVDERPVKETSIDGMPLIQVYYNEPVSGNKTVSVQEELEGIQTQIDLINAKISACSQLTPSNIIFVDDTSGVKPTDLNNKDGQVYSIGMGPGMSQMPVQYVTPAPFDPQWQQMLDFYIQKAYDMVGISQLSAQSRKPSGLNSGAALATMEDIESDRFETQTTHYINAFVNVTKKLIEVLPEDWDILPGTMWCASMKWKDLKEQSKLFKVQYSAASSLSKDPAERLKQIMQLTQVGLVGAEKVAELMDMPDLSEAYNDASAVSMAIQSVINNAVEHDIIDIPEFVNYGQLATEIASVQNQLYASMRVGEKEENKKVAESLKRINKLDEKLTGILVETGYIDVTPDEAQTTDDGSLAVGAQNSATQAVSSADALNVANVEDQIDAGSSEAAM